MYAVHTVEHIYESFWVVTVTSRKTETFEF